MHGNQTRERQQRREIIDRARRPMDELNHQADLGRGEGGIQSNQAKRWMNSIKSNQINED